MVFIFTASPCFHVVPIVGCTTCFASNESMKVSHEFSAASSKMAFILAELRWMLVTDCLMGAVSGAL